MNEKKTDGKLMFFAELIAFLSTVVVFIPNNIIVLAKIQLPALAKDPSLVNGFLALMLFGTLLGFLCLLVYMPLSWIKRYRKKGEGNERNRG